MEPSWNHEVQIHQPTMNRVKCFIPGQEVVAAPLIPYYKRHTIRRKSALDRIVNHGRRLAYNFLAKKQQGEDLALPHAVMRYYNWNVFQKHSDIWEWVRSHSYNRSWTRDQRAGFLKLLEVLSDMARNSSKKDANDTTRQRRRVTEMFDEGLKDLQITNLMILSSGRYEYRFFPVEESQPVHQRMCFTATEQAYIDKFLPGYWMDEDDETLEMSRLQSTFPVRSSVATTQIESPDFSGTTKQPLITSEEELKYRTLRAREHVYRAMEILDVILEGNNKELSELLEVHELGMEHVAEPMVSMMAAFLERRQEFNQQQQGYC